MPVEGATVTIAEYNASTETDENGEFELEIPLVGQAFEELEITAFGYENKSTTVRGHSDDTKRFWLDERSESIRVPSSRMAEERWVVFPSNYATTMAES